MTEPNKNNPNNQLPMVLHENVYNSTALELSTATVAQKTRRNELCFRLNHQYTKVGLMWTHVVDGYLRYSIGNFHSYVPGLTLDNLVNASAPSCAPTPDQAHRLIRVPLAF